MTTLNYLDFDFIEIGDGYGALEAMATVSAAQLPALLKEVAAVLDWSEDQFPDRRGPLEEGDEWDFQLQCQQEWSVDEALLYDFALRTFSRSPDTPGVPRHHLTLSLSGTGQFVDAFRASFG